VIYFFASAGKFCIAALIIACAMMVGNCFFDGRARYMKGKCCISPGVIVDIRPENRPQAKDGLGKVWYIDPLDFVDLHKKGYLMDFCF